MKIEKRGPRVNEQIRVTQVRVVVEDTNEQLGILPTHIALERAREAGLDLVEVAETARPPVCKIMDYGAFKFQESKKAREARKKESKVTMKEMRFTPRTADHDLQIKAKKIKEFLDEGHKVQVTVKFKGRENHHATQGHELMDKLVTFLGDDATVEAAAKKEGSMMSMMLVKKKK
jgi:translation initiation factor IF-3